MFSKFLPDSVKNPLFKLKQSIKEMGKQMIIKQKLQIIEIVPNKLYHISYPTNNTIGELLQQFKSANQYQLWNIGEYSYSQEILSKLIGEGGRNSDGKQIVYNLTYEYFANIPFVQMIKAIQSIQTFLSMNPSNKVYIHCQLNQRRSAVFLASYIFLTGMETDIVQSILCINKLLNISIEEKQAQNSLGSIYKSQHLVLKNLMNYINNNSFINKKSWHLKKILINNAPKIHSVLKILPNSEKPNNDSLKFKILLQIRSIQGIIYKKIFNDQIIEGESLCLRISQIVLLKDDFLIIVKYVYQKKGYSILRSQLNTNFIYDQYCRVQRNDMDLSAINSITKNDMIFMDLLLEANQNDQSELSKLNILKDSSQKSSTIQSLEQKKQFKQSSMNQNKKQSESDEDDFKILDQEQEAEHNQKMQKQIQEQLERALKNIRKKKNKSSQLKQSLPEQKGNIKQEEGLSNQALKQSKNNNVQILSTDICAVQIENQQKNQQKQNEDNFIQQNNQKCNKIDQVNENENNSNPSQIIQIKEELQISIPISKEDEIKKQKQEQLTKPPQIYNSKEVKIQNSISSVQRQEKTRSNQEQSSQEQSSGQSSSEQEESQEQQQQDLDAYMSKLQKQAEKNH